jgi:hypothetical protein
MTRQEQSVDEGGNAYQAGRDLTVQHGFSSEQMAELMVAMAKQLSAFTAEANAKLDERLKEFRDHVLREFSNGNETQREAFNDPDFQFSLQEAQNTYARSGDADLRSELVRLLLERSGRGAGDRVSFILNAAIKVAGQLTTEERALLVVLFVIKTVVVTSTSIEPVYARYRNFLAPYVYRLPTTETSFEYLQSLGCLNIERVADHYPLADNFARRYGHIFPRQRAPGVVVPGQNAAHDVEKPITPTAVIDEFQKRVPEIEALLGVWDDLLFKHSNLTALGKALAHSVLSGDGKMDASLNVFLS